MQRAFAAVLVAGLLAACSSSKPAASGSSTTAPPRAAPRFDVVLDDKGLTFPPGKTSAGSYLISFEDRRSSPPAGQHLHLQFLPSGPQILLIDVPEGTSSTHVLRANMVADVVDLDAGEVPAVGQFLRPETLAHRHSIGDIPVTNPPSIETTPEYPTPVT